MAVAVGRPSVSAGAALPVPAAPPAQAGPRFRAGAAGSGGPGGGSGRRLWACAGVARESERSGARGARRRGLLRGAAACRPARPVPEPSGRKTPSPPPFGGFSAARCFCLPLRAHLFSRDRRDARRARGFLRAPAPRGRRLRELLARARCHAALEAAPREKGGISAVASPEHCEASGPPRHPPGRPALPRMWTKALGAHTKFAQGALVGRVGARGRRTEEAGARGARQAGRARGAPGGPRLAATEGPRGRSRRRSPRLGCETAWLLGAGLGGRGLSPGSASGPRGKEGEGAAAAAGPRR